MKQEIDGLVQKNLLKNNMKICTDFSVNITWYVPREILRYFLEFICDPLQEISLYFFRDIPGDINGEICTYLVLKHNIPHVSPVISSINRIE